MPHSFPDPSASHSCSLLFGLSFQSAAIHTGRFPDLLKCCFINPYLSIPKVLEILESPPEDARIQIIIEKCREQIAAAQSLQEQENFQKTLKDRMKSWVEQIGNPDLDDWLELLQIFPSSEKNLASLIYNTPARIGAYLQRYVKGQDQAIKTLSLCFYLHLLRTGVIQVKGSTVTASVNLPIQNPLLLGSTGTGKTYLLKKMAALFNIPFASTNCGSLVSEGYVGPQLSDAFTQLFLEDEKGMSSGIILLDEFDKLSKRYSQQEIKGTGVQIELLTMLGRTSPVQFKTSFKRDASYSHVSTEKIFFVMAGAFTGLQNQKVGRPFIGFQQSDLRLGSSQPSDFNARDLISYGIMPEIVSRIHTIITLRDHSKESLKEILLHSKETPLKGLRSFWQIHGDEFHISEEETDEIIEEALLYGKGARGLEQALYDRFASAMTRIANENNQSPA